MMLMTEAAAWSVAFVIGVAVDAWWRLRPPPSAVSTHRRLGR
ncbi:hypothetical protein [Streptomyces chartreusis]